MRAFQVLATMLCLVCGLFLLWQAPGFFLPDRFDPSRGWLLAPRESRLLGAGLLCCATAGARFLGQRYYRADAGRPGLSWLHRHFILMLLTIGLISAALMLARQAPNPDYRPPAANPAGAAR